MEQQLANKVSMKTMGEVLERLNQLESMMGIDELSTDRSIETFSIDGYRRDFTRKNEATPKEISVDLLSKGAVTESNPLVQSELLHSKLDSSF